MTNPANAIPVIDFAPFLAGDRADKRHVASQIDKACTEIGFFILTGHGVPQALIDKTRATAKEFFALPEADKFKVERPPEKISRGYFKVGDRAVSYSLGKAAPPDLNEAFAWGPEISDAERPTDELGAKLMAPNRWPSQPVHFKDQAMEYRIATARVASQLLRAMAIALNVREDFFADKFVPEKHAGASRFIRYPAVREMPQEGQLRSGAHTDYGLMTFVRGDNVPGGLQVKMRHGDWIDVRSPTDSFVCNIGDMMERWTNDHWVSTLHRVAIPPPQTEPQDRISLVSFFNPLPGTMIECFETCRGPNGEEKYPPATSTEVYFSKLMKTAHAKLDANAKDVLEIAG